MSKHIHIHTGAKKAIAKVADKASCTCKSHAKDAKRFVVGGMITLKNGKQAKVLEESETRVKVKEGDAEHWVDLNEIQMPKAKDAEYSEQARSALIAKAKKARQDFEHEARELGGAFSGPGVWNDVKKALEGK